AAVDAEGDAAAAEEEDNTILCLDDLPADVDCDTAMNGDDELFEEEFTEEAFDRAEDEDAHLSPKAFEAPKKMKAPATQRTKKPPKGATRAEVEALAKTMKAKKDMAAAKKPIQNKDSAAASKKAGLSKAFLAASLKAAVAPLSPTKLGGLTDEDAASTRPTEFLPSSKARTNEVQSRSLSKLPSTGLIYLQVVMIESSEPEDTPTKAPETAPKRPEHKIKSEGKMPALLATPSITKTPKTPKARMKGVKTEPSTDTFTPDSSADVKGLPALAGVCGDMIYHSSSD
ncbi:hypothetical protein C8J57DRAFT_1263893, partial [Mycena rebaudengoi]